MTTQTIAGIARFGLEPSIEIGSVAPGTWPSLRDDIRRERLGGHAAHAAASGALQLTDQQHEELLTLHEQQLAIDLRVERLLAQTEQLLTRAAISSRVLKGPAIAHRFYVDPALRSFGDGDLLVAGADMDRAIDVLAEAGLYRRFEQPRKSFDRRFVKAVTLLDECGLELDLHRALTPGPYGVLLDADAIRALPPDHINLGGRPLACLSPEASFVHACAHAVLGDPAPRYMPVRDVAQMLLSNLDPATTIALFERFDAGAIASRALETVRRLLDHRPGGPIVDWIAAYDCSARDRWRLRSYDPGSKRYARQAAATFWVLPGIRDRLAYATALAFPERRYVKARDGGYARRVARGTTLVMRERPQ